MRVQIPSGTDSPWSNGSDFRFSVGRYRFESGGRDMTAWLSGLRLFPAKEVGGISAPQVRILPLSL